MKARYTVVEGEVIAQKRNGVRHLLVSDAQGSTVALMGSSSTITDTFEYWPYGEVRTRTGSTTMPFQYIGALGYYRDSSGRTYVRARTLRTDLGRWMTADPLWPRQRTFVYCAASPITKTDRSGRRVEYFDCSDEDIDRLEWAISDIRRLWNTWKLHAFMTCLNPKPCSLDYPYPHSSPYDNQTMAGCMEMYLANFFDASPQTNIHFRCCSWGDWCHILGDCRGSQCSRGHNYGGNLVVIYVCPDFWDKCGAWACAVLHEMLHGCGQIGHVEGAATACLENIAGCQGQTGING
ncbi:MAG: hypothetical protein K1X67_25600 [Fimbriimonadaceae bacterium]|nr:hypothetical protein [Fimbriimonadaceae bacterium]